MLIMKFLEDGQRLTVVAQCLQRLLDIQMPVAHTVETMSLKFWVIEHLREFNRLMVI